MSAHLDGAIQRAPRQVDTHWYHCALEANCNSVTSFLGRSVSSCLNSEVGRAALQIMCAVIPLLLYRTSPILAIGVLCGYEFSQIRCPTIDTGIDFSAQIIYLLAFIRFFHMIVTWNFSNVLSTIVEGIAANHCAAYYQHRAQETLISLNGSSANRQTNTSLPPAPLSNVQETNLRTAPQIYPSQPPVEPSSQPLAPSNMQETNRTVPPSGQPAPLLVVQETNQRTSPPTNPQPLALVTPLHHATHESTPTITSGTTPQQAPVATTSLRPVPQENSQQRSHSPSQHYTLRRKGNTRKK
jgi:hypothetical protein